MKKYGIKLLFDIPSENDMIIDLFQTGLVGINGIVEYSEAFFK